MSEMIDRLNHLLQTQNISKSKLCDELNLSNNTFYKWSIGQVPSATTLLKVAQYLNTTIEYLLTGQEEENTVEQKMLLQDFATLKPEYQSIILKNIEMFKELS